MKFYQYWVKEPVNINIGGEQQASMVYGHSNDSEEDARENARQNAHKVEARIAGKSEDEDDYEIAMREEIVERIDDHNLISRNRYGALILNSENTMFVDIDDAPFPGFFKMLFGGGAKGSKLDRIVSMIEERIEKNSAYKNLGFRIYETRAGVRMIVTGREFPPRDKQTRALMRDFNADRLYTFLCHKQDCFRARLTPKASRMHHKGHLVQYPRTSEQEQTFQDWLAGYESKSSEYGVCRLVKEIGLKMHSSIIDLHDEKTCALKGKRLA